MTEFLEENVAPPSPEFRVVLRGYDRDEVDAHLQVLSQRLEAAQRQLATRRRDGETSGGGAPEPGQLAVALFRRLEEEAAQLRRQAERDADRVRTEGEAHARRVQTQAEEQALGLVDEARAEAARVRQEHADLAQERERVRRQAHDEAQALLRRAAERAHEQAEAIVAAAEDEAPAVLEQATVRARELGRQAEDVSARLRRAAAAVSDLSTVLDLDRRTATPGQPVDEDEVTQVIELPPDPAAVRAPAAPVGSGGAGAVRR